MIGTISAPLTLPSPSSSRLAKSAEYCSICSARSAHSVSERSGGTSTPSSVGAGASTDSAMTGRAIGAVSATPFRLCASPISRSAA